MSVYLLPNTIGDAAATCALEAGTTSYGELNDLIAGPRSTFWRSVAASSAIAPMFTLSSDVIATHMVVARADWMVTLAGARVRARQRSSGGVWSHIVGVDYNTLTAGSLLGPKSQDLVFAVSPTNYRGYGLEFDSVGTEAMQISKFYPSVGFQFDGDLVLNPAPQWTAFPLTQSVNMFAPLKSYDAYEVEAQISLTWKNCSRANIRAFEALPQILNWPLFIYDDAGDVWNWKLEHVVIEGWAETFTAIDYSDITVTFQRLKLYE
jgi:hypothetical protein